MGGFGGPPSSCRVESATFVALGFDSGTPIMPIMTFIDPNLLAMCEWIRSALQFGGIFIFLYQ